MVFVAPKIPQVTRFFDFGTETWGANALHTHIYAVQSAGKLERQLFQIAQLNT
jgi:hypothetical protein